MTTTINLLLIKPEGQQNSIDTAALDLYDIAVTVIDWSEYQEMTETPFDMVLLINSPAFDDMSLIQHLHSIAPACKLIVALPHSTMQATSYLRSGVSGVINSFADTRRLAEVVHTVYRGEYYLDHDIAQFLAMRQIKKTLEPFILLGSREFDVFCMLAEGQNLQTIAKQLDISGKTVSNCQSQIKAKLGLDSREAITDFAKTHGVIR
ncbi:MAG: response regulator transcription factor [Methylomonas sp.]|nr:response regulator transcription factor [Methylomonas sp.]